MEKVVALVSDDEAYVVRLKEYLNTKEDFGFKVSAFTDEDSFRRYLQRNKVEILVAEESMMLEGITTGTGITHAYALTDYGCIAENSNMKMIFKYRSGKVIADEIKRYYFEEGGFLDAKHGSGSCELVSVCSPEGGCRKTSFAIAYAMKCAMLKKTLFISFDPFQTYVPRAKGDGEQSLSDIVYFMAESKKSIENKIASAIHKTDSFDYICGVTHWYDTFDFNHERMRLFIKTVVGKLGYELVVIDVGEFDVSSMEILFASDRIYVPGSEGRGGNLIYEEWERQMKFISGDEVLGRVSRICVPFDEKLEQGGYGFEILSHGKLADFAATCVANEAAESLTTLQRDVVVA